MGRGERSRAHQNDGRVRSTRANLPVTTLQLGIISKKCVQKKLRDTRDRQLTAPPAASPQGRAEKYRRTAERRPQRHADRQRHASPLTAARGHASTITRSRDVSRMLPPPRLPCETTRACARFVSEWLELRKVDVCAKVKPIKDSRARNRRANPIHFCRYTFPGSRSNSFMLVDGSSFLGI